MTRFGWIDTDAPLALSRQCELVGISRSTVYAHQKPVVEASDDVALCHVIDEIYTAHPFYGTRRMVVALARRGHCINRKRVQRLMRGMVLAGIAPGAHTSQKHPENKVYPYLLRGMAITRPNQAWSIDITYVRLPRGFVYLVAIIDWYSRKVLSWRLSNTMDAALCVDALQDALSLYGSPEIFNSDQGSQFTSAAFTGLLKRNEVQISMDGRGRAFDNIFVERLWRTVKYEDVYLRGYASLGELTIGLSDYFQYYNADRPHQSLKNRTPDEVYRNGQGGGASIPDHFKAQPDTTGNENTGQRCAAVEQAETLS